MIDHKIQNFEKLPASFSPAASASTPTTGVDLWLLDFSQLDNLPANISNILSADELIRADTYKKNKHHFIATRALLRKALAHYTEVNPQELEFSRTQHGKPFLANNSVFFNLSHCNQFAVLAVSTQAEIGVDIETLREHNFLKIAQRYFHSDELQALNTCEESNRRILFYKLWTLKEAFFKALGGGISTGLNKASFSLTSESIKANFAADLHLSAAEWQFKQVLINSSTVVALALNTSRAIELQWFNGNELLSKGFT